MPVPLGYRGAMRRTLLIPTALVLAALALAGCSATTSAYESSGDSGGVAAPEIGSVPEDGAVFGETIPGGSVSGGSIPGGSVPGGSVSGAAKSDADVSSDRQVIQTGYATVVVKKPLDAATDAIRITEQSGGRVDGRNEYAPTAGNQGSATLTLRIPISALDATLDKLKALGTVQEVSLSSTDVTMQSQDLDARITALSASVDRLVALLSTATDTDTLISLETAISDRQGELDSLQSQQSYLADQVAMSTVTLNLISPDQAIVTEPDTFLSGLQAGWAALVAFFAGLLVALGVLLPWLVLVALIVTVIVTLVRRTRRRDSAGALYGSVDGPSGSVDTAPAIAATPATPTAGRKSAPRKSR